MMVVRGAFLSLFVALGFARFDGESTLYAAGLRRDEITTHKDGVRDSPTRPRARGIPLGGLKAD
jgi:hypothetical protein